MPAHPSQQVLSALYVSEDGNELSALRAENAKLRSALDSRIVIEQAKGAISVIHDTTPAVAFELRGLARSQRRNIHEDAAAVVARQGRLDV